VFGGGAPGNANGVTETPKEIVREVERGESPETPFVLWTGMHLLIGAVVFVIAGACLLIYYLVK
jgi:hypothetical protein